MPDLALALNNLGNEFSSVGRLQEALAPTEEATQLYRDLAAANPALVPNLAAALTNLGIHYSGVGGHRQALAPAEEAVQLRRELAATNPAFLPDLALALTNLGNRYSNVGRYQAGLALAEEAVRLRRDLAAANPAFLPNLATALTNLGAHYSNVGRDQEALVPTEEAVHLYRDLAATNPAFQPNLAGALNNVGTFYSRMERYQRAVTPAVEAVQLYRDLVVINPAFLPNLAMALSSLGACYSDLGRYQEAVTAAEEATQLYVELTATNPATLPDLAMALAGLDNRYREAGFATRKEDAWEQALTEAGPWARAFLLVARSGMADAGQPAAVAWLTRALAVGVKDRGLVGSVHEEARRHRSSAPAAFDQSWERHTGVPIPAWLTVDPTLLSLARAWVAADSYTAERDHLVAHPELLGAGADIAVAEALLAVPEGEAARYPELRQVARQDGVHAAYRPLVLSILAVEFIRADPRQQRALLAERQDDLLTDIVAAVFDELVEQEGGHEEAASRAAALLDLASTGDAEAVFEALTDRGQFPGLLHELATRPDAGSLTPAAVVAYSAATAVTEAATALFYLAVAMAEGGNAGQASDLIRQARAADPAQVPAWINKLAEIGQHHHGALQVIPYLTAPADPPAPSGSPSQDMQ